MKRHTPVRAKKFLGQHFLTDEQVARNIVAALELPDHVDQVLEIGPGTGVLTKYLLEERRFVTRAVEIDRESVPYLLEHFPALKGHLIEGDFLKLDLAKLFPESFAIIGNFPYNISTQILFRVLEYKDRIPLVVGMFQKEVAERIASPPGNRDYGILSVLLQPWYDIEYLFTVHEQQFDPPPRVKSGVIRLVRNERSSLNCDPAFFITVVKCGFSQRRKTLRNALRPLLPSDFSHIPYLDLRAEALSWQQFEELARLLKK
ncbi:MAG: 16S rRNA (adenine(1518)-N(6)/adenine(1519)-N(6))-dimethyltransferase RsmA [Bacteroidia bacterium]|nr:16S rRNA (adenine(1518)-N(6)/adenine(1519)-N(6))-dimethyltransferase RsmA [Bacteroidia bacterium]